MGSNSIRSGRPTQEDVTIRACAVLDEQIVVATAGIIFAVMVRCVFVKSPARRRQCGNVVQFQNEGGGGAPEAAAASITAAIASAMVAGHEWACVDCDGKFVLERFSHTCCGFTAKKRVARRIKVLITLVLCGLSSGLCGLGEALLDSTSKRLGPTSICSFTTNTNSPLHSPSLPGSVRHGGVQPGGVAACVGADLS